MKILSILLIVIVLSITEAFSQISIYPQAVFLNMQNRSGNMKVMNSSGEPKEISIEVKYGYPGLDSTGKSQMVYDDSLTAKIHDATPHIKIFPKRLILDDKEEQTVRFMLGNIGHLDDGTYFARVFITSKNPPEEIDTSYTETISARLDIQFTLIAALVFQKGRTTNEIEINGISSHIDSGEVNIVFDFERKGNSPFFGTSIIRLFDMNGNLVSEKRELSPLYFSGKKAYNFSNDEVDNGKYKVELLISNEHKDVPDNFKIPFTPIKKEYNIEIFESQ